MPRPAAGHRRGCPPLQAGHEPPTDEIIDVHNELKRIMVGPDAADLNERLRLVFDRFEMDTMPDGTVAMLPVLRDDVIERFADTFGAVRVITSTGKTLQAPYDPLPEGAGPLVLVEAEMTRRIPTRAIYMEPIA